MSAPEPTIAPPIDDWIDVPMTGVIRHVARENREGFERMPVWTIFEAAFFSGLSRASVADYVRKPQKLVGGARQFRFLRWGNRKRRGAIVDAESFKAWLRSGEPQGEFVESKP